MTRDPLGIISATLLTIVVITAAVPAITAGGWWLLFLIPDAFLAAVAAYGYAASVPRRHRDEKGNPIR